MPGQGGLAVALLIGGTLISPPVGYQGAGCLYRLEPVRSSHGHRGAGIWLIPYSLELVALRRLGPNVFSILISLEPVFAGLFGWLLLSQNLSALKISAILLVVIASIIQTVAKPA